MIRNYTLDENVKPERNRGTRRKNNYFKAKRFKDIVIYALGFDSFNVPIGRYVKNTSLNGAESISGWNKTKNKGPNHNGTYAPTHNYKYSDLKRIESMNEDWAEYIEGIA